MKEYRAWKQTGRKKSMRLLAMLLACCLMFTTCPEIPETLYVFAAAGQEEKDTVYVAGFDDMQEEVKEQTVSVGTGLDGLTLPDMLEASVIVSDKGNDTEDAGQEAEETESEETDTEAADLQAEEASAEETETNDVQTEESVQDNSELSEEADGTEEPAVTETADDTENNGESLHSETYTVTMEEYYAENVVTVETLTADNAQVETITITGVTWTSEPEYDGNTEGTYIFTAFLPEGYVLMEGVSLPKITVTVQESEEETEETEDTEVLALLDRIAALPDLEEYLAAEPDMDEDEDAYEGWLETLYVHAEEAPAIWEEYEILTEEQKAHIPETELAKLTTWVEFAETLADSMAVMTVATTVDSGTCGTDLTWTLDSDGTLTISGSGEMSSFSQTTMPWYSNITDIKTVTIENGVTSIGNYAFRGCSSLESITIPSGVTSIGTCAFYDCSSLTSIEIPESVTSIGTYVFRGCSLLESITIPSGVTSIGTYTFFGCSSLTSIEIPSGVTSIGNFAFHSCSSLESIKISENVTSIGASAFYGCSSLTSIEIPSGVTSIGTSTFYNCSSLESIKISENVTSIGTYTFYGCSSLTSIEIPSGVTSIGNSTFYNCNSLESIKISENVTSIGNSTFCNCSSLTRVEIPSGVTSIGDSAFKGCSALALVIMERTSPATLGTNVFKGCKFVTDSRKDLVVPAGTRDSYVSEANWSSWAVYIHEDHDDDEPMTAWTDTTSLPVAAGSYYLAKDVTLDAAWSVPSGTTKLCLNGHTITFESGYIDIGSGNTLYICDCDEQERGSICNSNGKVVLNSGILEVTGGSIKGTATSAPAIMNMPGGTVTIRNGKVSGASTVTVTNNGSLSISGGSIINSNSAGYAVNNLGMIELSGSPTLTGSKADINNLRSGAYIAVTDTLTGIFSIETADKPAVDAPVTLTNSTTTEYNSTDNFTSADASYKVQKNSSGQLELVVISYTVTLNGNGGNSGATLTSYTYGTGATLPTDWTKTGYTFAGWYDNEDCTGTAVTEISTTDMGDKEYWAKWTPVSYTITYSLDGGTATGNPTSYTIESNDITIINPTKEGYTFTGWSGTDLTGSDNTSVTIAAGSTGNREYTANWTAADYKVTLNGNGGNSGATLTSYTYGTGAVLPTDWTKTGYTFASWYDNEDCTGTAVTEISTTDIGDKEYWAKWTPVSYTITYSLDGGTVTGNPTSYTIESSAITLINPTKEGYTFIGWSGTDLTGSDNTSVIIASGSTGEREYTANWSANSYTVTLHGNGGSGDTTLTSYTYGTRAVLPTDWTKTGYTFAGWYDNADCTGTAVTEISTTDIGDKEYWAKWVDDIAPVIGDLSYSYKPKNLWHWLIGKDDLIITVPVTEEGSGADEIIYTITPEGGMAEQKTAVIKNGTATITLSAGFQGTIAITCTDKDGNTSAGVTAGAALDADGKGFLIEDNAPEITFAANNGENISSEYYDAAPDITVTVTDDADNAISAGIASITYRIGNGEEITVNKDFTEQMVTEWEFSITADDIPTGETKITITATDNAGNEKSGTITVKVKGPESKPAAAINYQTEMLTGLEPNADYTINGTAYQADADGCIAIEESWIGTTIELVRKGNGTETTDSEAQEISFSARPSAPSIMPELDSRTDSSITLKTIDGAQYRISGGNWQESTEFTGLAAGTEYTFTIRYEATATAFASEESAPASIYTLPSAPAQGAAQIDYAQETLTLGDGAEAFADEACTVPIASGSISDYIGQTIYIRYAADGEIPASGVTAVTIPERPSAPAAGTQNATYPGAADGKITGLSENTVYEIRKKNDDGTWGEWTNAILTGTEISNLAAGEYEIRIQAVEGESFRSEATSVTIGETPATSEATPEIRIDYRQEILTGFIAGEEYKITVNEKIITVTADTDGTLKLEEEWLGTTVSIVKSGNGKDKLDSEAQSVSIPARTAQTPAPGAEDESSPGADDGKLTGLEAGKTYQISTDNGATWTDVTADANGEITNLAPGSYIVRTGSTDTDFAGNPSAPVTIAACPVAYTVTLHGNGGSGTALTSYTYGEGAALPTDWTKTGYTFAGWYDNEDCTGTAVTAISSSDTGDKEYWAKWNKKSSDSSDNGSDDNTDNSDNETGDSDNNTDNSNNDTDNSDNASDSDDKEQPETPIVPDNQPDDKKEPTDERRDDSDSTQQEDEEAQKQTEPSKDTDTTTRIPEGETVQTVPVEIEDGKLVLTGESVETGNLTDTSKTTTVLMLGDGAVIVTVNCEDDHYTAGVKDTVAVANIVLTPEQLQLVYDGEVIEIRIDVNDISQTVGEQDKAVIEQGLEAWRQEIPELTLGMYVDISMFIRIGGSDWDAITSTDEPIEIVIGIPENLQEDGREFYIIRSHEGEYALLNDKDSDADTITISTDSFSAYAIAYRTTGETSPETGEAETAKCGLCHICPTFLGICCFIWLAVAIAVLIVIWIILRKRKERKDAE